MAVRRQRSNFVPPCAAGREPSPAFQQQPVEQQDTVHPKNSKDDVEAIGNRKVGKGPNFYSLEKEIALGKQLAQEVERSSKLIDDPVVTEYGKPRRTKPRAQF